MKLKSSGLIVTFLLLVSFPVQACTLWAVNGTAVTGGGSVIVKNRDWLPNQHQYVKLYSPASGYRYFGLVVDGEYPGMKEGINEKGLVVVSATAGSIPAEQRRAMPHTHGILVKLLKECSSVHEAVQKTELFLGPEFIMIADKNETAVIEIGPDGKYSINTKKNGAIYHTNHYVDAAMVKYNQVSHESSLTRYHRIGQLIDTAAKPSSDFATCLSFSHDQNDGPDNSIFRTGSTPKKTRTMSVWAVNIPQAGSPEIYVRILNPDEKEQIISCTADDVFSGKIVLN